MAQRLIALDGQKGVTNILDSDDPAVWNYFGGHTDASSNELYSRVAAAFRAVNKKARAVSNVPFVIMKGNTEYDDSSTWQNNVGFMPKPKDLIRRTMQSLIMSNKSYWIMGKNRVGIPKQLHFAVQSSININTDSQTGQLKSLDRMVGGRVEKSYQPDDHDLIRFWWLDDTTELLPTPNTEFKAIMNAARLLYYADFFTANFFRRGGVKPTLIAMKGLISKGKEDELSTGWTKFLNGIGSTAKSITAKIFNAEAMDIKSFGDGLGDLKETPVFRRALEDIAIGVGMPLSMLLSNSNSYATASVEERGYLRDEIVPWFDYIADEANYQIFEPMGLHLENRAETQDPNQEQAVSSATAASTFMDFVNKAPSADIAIETANMMGHDLTDGLIAAIQKHFADKEVNAAKLREQMKPVEKPIEKPIEKPVEQKPIEIVSVNPPVKSKAWFPTLDEMNELRIWRDVALRYFKRAEPIPEYQPHHGGLPENINEKIKLSLITANSIEAIKAAFDMDTLGIAQTTTETPEYKSNDSAIIALAQAMNRLADGIPATKTTDVPNMTFNLTTQMPEQGAPNVTIKAQMPEQLPPVINVQASPVTVENTTNLPETQITVQASPVTVENVVNVPETNVVVNNDVRPSPVIIKPAASARVIRNKDGKIQGLESE